MGGGGRSEYPGETVEETERRGCGGGDCDSFGRAYTGGSLEK